jgi:hypothetical protein
MREGNGAHFAVFESDGVTGVHFAADAVQTEQLAGHLETGDLITTVLDQHVGLEKAAANRVDRLETLPGTVQMIAALQAPARRNQFVQLFSSSARGLWAGTARAGCSSNRRSSRLQMPALPSQHSSTCASFFIKPCV